MAFTAEELEEMRRADAEIERCHGMTEEQYQRKLCYNREWRKRNHDSFIAYQRAYREKNHDKIRAYQKAYYKRMREALKIVQERQTESD